MKRKLIAVVLVVAVLAGGGLVAAWLIPGSRPILQGWSGKQVKCPID